MGRGPEQPNRVCRGRRNGRLTVLTGWNPGARSAGFQLETESSWDCFSKSAAFQLDRKQHPSDLDPVIRTRFPPGIQRSRNSWCSPYAKGKTNRANFKAFGVIYQGFGENPFCRAPLGSRWGFTPQGGSHGPSLLGRDPLARSVGRSR